MDIFPTLVEMAGAQLSDSVKQQVEGRSLLPLLKEPNARWPDRLLVTHVGRWPRGSAADWKFKGCCIRNSRFALVNDNELYDLRADPGQTKNVLGQNPEVVAKLRAAYDRWWRDILPWLENEDAIGPRINPFKALYWKQFGGGPDEALLREMDPDRATGLTGAAAVERLDVGSEQDLDALVTKIGATPIDILICNACSFPVILIQIAQFNSQNRRLNFVKPRVPS